MNPIYARVIDGVIVEYPVYLIHIQNRALPLEWFTEVIYDVKPDVPPFHYAKETPRVENGTEVHIGYEVIALTLSDLLLQASGGNRSLDTEATPIDVNTLDPALIARIQFLAEGLVQDLLDEFAREKGYDSMLSLISYKDSTIPTFASEASTGITMRDTTWVSVNTYLSEVLAGTKPVPRSQQEILDNVPDLIWPTA